MMNVEFLPPKSVSKAVFDLLKDAKRVKLAVSFWGISAVGQLGLSRTDFECSVVLNLMSGAVDPAVVDAVGRNRVKAHNALHTKVYWTDKGAIVGSCNASANGLGLANGELATWKESAVFLAPGTKAWHDAEECVDALIREGSRIDDEMLATAKQRWKKRREVRPGPSGPSISLAKALEDEPGRIQDLNLWILLEASADAPKMTKVEAEAMTAMGLDQNKYDPWELHVPLGMRALCFEFINDEKGMPSFEWLYFSEIPNKPAAHLVVNGEDTTVGEAFDKPKSLECAIGVSFSKAADSRSLQPIFRYLWRHRKEEWNSYRHRAWDSVLVSLDAVIELMPKILKEPG